MFWCGATSPLADGVLTSLFFADEQELCRCMSLVAGGGFSAEGLLTVVIRSDSEEEESCRENMEAILRGKKSLLRKAIGAASAMAVTITAGGEQTAIFPATLEFDELLAAAQFLICLRTQAAAQKQVRVQDRPVENEKYAMHCFLLRIGMIGTQYKASRRILLRDLEGNSSFKSRARRPWPDAGEVAWICNK